MGDDCERGVVGTLRQAQQRFSESLAPYGTVTVSHNTATAQTGPGPALASRRPADTTRMPACRLFYFGRCVPFRIL